VSIFLSLGNMALLDAFLSQPLSQDVIHALRWEGNVERIVGFVLGHCCDIDVLGIGEIGKRRIIHTQKLGDFTHTI